MYNATYILLHSSTLRTYPKRGGERELDLKIQFGDQYSVQNTEHVHTYMSGRNRGTEGIYLSR